MKTLSLGNNEVAIVVKEDGLVQLQIISLDALAASNAKVVAGIDPSNDEVGWYNEMTVEQAEMLANELQNTAIEVRRAALRV